MKNWVYTIFALISFAQISFAQPGEVEIQERDGKQFYVHIVQQGNTLWGLHTTYKVPVDLIIQENPTVENGLAIGQVVWIPVVTVIDKVPTKAGKTHTVQQGETLYGISREYGVSIDELLELNPKAAEGLSIGQQLIIEKGNESLVNTESSEIVSPAPVNATKVIFKDSLIEHTVLKHETLYSISKRFMVPVDTLVRINQIQQNKIRTGDVLVIPLKKESLNEIEVRQVPPIYEDKRVDNELIFQSKDQFNIAVLLPMNYDMNGAIYGVTPNAVMNRFTKVATEFYMGVKFAIDSLSRMGLNATVTLFDTKADSLTTLNVLKKMETTEWDLIIGPLMPGPSKAVAQWAKKHKTPVLAPVPIPLSNLKDNRYVFASVPSDVRLLEGMADELIKNHAKSNIILVNSGLKSDAANYDVVRKRINDQLTASAHRSALKEINLGATSGADISKHINKDMVTIFIVPSSNRVFAANFMTTMNKVRNISKTYEEADIRIYGLKEWDNFEEIKLDYKRRLNLHYPSSISLNFNLEKTQQFIQLFRNKYGTDPDKYAMQGFDVTMHFILQNLLKSEQHYEGVINDIHYSTIGAQNGYENKNVFVIRYNQFTIEEAGRVH